MKVLRLLPWLGRPLWNMCVTNDHGSVPRGVNTSRSFPHSWLIIVFVTRLTRWISLVEQELFTLQRHLRSPPVFSVVRVTRPLVLCVYFVDRGLSFCTFSLAIVLSVLLQFTHSDYPFGIIKLLYKEINSLTSKGNCWSESIRMIGEIINNLYEEDQEGGNCFRRSRKSLLQSRIMLW